jgi:multidrug efflux pump
LNIYSQVGLITLVGLIARNGILVVEFANKQQEQGKSKLESVQQTSIIRLRPVMMTSIATITGHTPLIFADGAGAGAGARNAIGLWNGHKNHFHTLRAALGVYVVGQRSQ